MITDKGRYLFILTSLWCNNLWSSEPRQIELNDGSVISGEIMAFDKGTYTIKSGTLGTLEIKDADIRAIRSETTNPVAQSSPLPHLAISSDPEVINAVTAGNLNGLLTNPDFMKLLENKKVKEIAQQIEQQQ